MTRLLPLMLATFVLAGCASYAVPGRGADMSVFTLPETDRTGQIVPAPAPAARLPATIAVARVQASGYRSRTSSGWGKGSYSLVTTRDVERDEDFQRLLELPQIEGVAPIGRLLVPFDLQDGDELRQAAAALRAELLLVYTIDTVFDTEDGAPPLSVISLGLLPTKTARVTTTASALMVDTRTGAVIAVAEGTAKTHQLANGWTSRAAVDQSRRRAERRALDNLLASVESSWALAMVRLSQPVPQRAPITWHRIEAGEPDEN